MTANLGVGPVEWAKIRAKLLDDGDRKLEGELLPIVADTTTQPSTGSKIKKFDAKIPSIYVAPGIACGLAGSLKSRDPTTTAQLDEWSSTPGYNIGVLARTVRALDVDVEDPALAEEIADVIGFFAELPKRTRANSSKFLQPFLLAGEFGKRVIETRAGRIEFLGNGQQWVLAGTHRTGAKLEWKNFKSIPRIELEVFEELWNELRAKYEVVKHSEPKSKEPGFVVEPRTADAAPSAHVDELRGLFKRYEQKHGESPFKDRGIWIEALGVINHHLGDAGLALQVELSSPFWNLNGNSIYGSCEEEILTRGLGSHPNPITLHGFANKYGISAHDPASVEKQLKNNLGDPNAFDEDERITHEKKLAQCKWTKLGEHKLLPAPEWLVKRVIPRKPLGAMYGPSGSGKSFSLLDMGLAIARGIPWRGMKTRQGAVGWLAAEALGSMRNRVLAYEKGHNMNVDGLDFHVLGAGIDLTNRETVRVIAESAPKGLVLIVVDTLAAAAGNANENSGEDMNPVLDNCSLLHEITGAAVLLIHHSGKDEAKGMRGWSGLRARLDYEGEIKARPDKSGLRDITMTKQRDGEEGQAMPFKLVPVPIDMDEDGEIITSAYVDHVFEHAGLKALAAARKGQGKWHRAIRQAVHVARDMRIEIEALVKTAIVNVPEDKRTASPRKQVIATLNEMVDLGELRHVDKHGTPQAVGGGYVEFSVPATVGANPDAEPTIDPDADLI